MQKVLYDRKCMIHPKSRSKDWWEYNWWDLFGIASDMSDEENALEEGTKAREVFLEPQHVFSFRKRKRRDSCTVNDSISIVSSNASVASEPLVKKSKRLSLAAFLSTPMKPVFKIGASKQQGSLNTSSKQDMSDEPCMLPPRKNLLRRSCSMLRSASMGPPAPVAVQQQAAAKAGNKSNKKSSESHHRLNRSWSQSVASFSNSLSSADIKRQEAIYELFSGEQHMVEDLELVKTTYRNSLLQLNILTEPEAHCIFGDLDRLLNLHINLRDQLESLRDKSGMVTSVAEVLMTWVPGLECYIDYCANHVHAKDVLNDKKESSKRFQDFLQRCLESPFSRKLDLWTFLDVPRSRLVKYPILIGEILRHTPSSHPDSVSLPRVIPILTNLLQKADKATGEAECTQVLTRLVWPVEISSDNLQFASAVLCSGELKDHRGNKLHCFLFDTGFLLTRPIKPGVKFNVCQPVIPANELEVEELEPLRASRNSPKTFRVSSADSSANANFVLTAFDEHSKKRWMDSIKQVIQSTLSSNRSHVTQRPLSALYTDGI